MTTNKLPSYDAITTALQECQAPLDAAELHGLMTGILAVTHSVKASIIGLHNVIPEPDSADETIQQGIRLLETLCALTALQLEDHAFGFNLLVPSDEATLAARTDAVGVWCQGFVSGLGEGGLSLPPHPNPPPRAGEGRVGASELTEIIHDLTAMSQVDTSDVEDSEEEEVAYHELVEYVRVVVMTIYSDIAADTKTNRTIH
jgi:uncharacterized protein YgfB (UPF0149 family)